MPRTGGVYSPPAGTKGIPDTTILSTPYNAWIDDMTADANAARPITAGGTGATSASGARDALGLAIGSNVQAYDAGLQSIAGLTTSADKMLYTTASDVYATTALTPFARTVLDDADAATMRATIGANNAANLTTGTISDARLPVTMSSKNFDSPVRIQGVTPSLYLRNTSNIIRTSFYYDEGSEFQITRLQDNAGANPKDFVLGYNGTIRWNGQTVWTAGNDGSGSGLDADLLDGQQGSYYLSPANLSAAVPVNKGGTGATTAAAARVNLDLKIGVDVQAYDATLAALAAFATNGFIARTGTDTFAGRTLTGTANEITVTNGNGVSGSPLMSLPAALTFTGKTVTGGTFSSPALAGTPTAPTQSTGDNSTKIATTAFVQNELATTGLKLLAEAPAAAASQYDFTGLPVGLTHVVVVLNGIYKSAAAASYELSIGTGGVFMTTGYIAKGVNSINGASSQGTSSANGFPLGAASGNQTITGALDLYCVNGDDWVLSGELATESGIAAIGCAGRLTNLGGDLERIRLSLTAGSFNTGGSISIFGE